MAILAMDVFRDAVLWTTTTGLGVTPSPLVSISDETADFHPGPGTVATRIQMEVGATDHRLSRSFAAQNLSIFSEVRLWIRSSRAAGTSHPQLMELRLGSAAFPVGHPSNTWSRALPISQANTWEPVRLALDDLAPGVRSAVSSLELRIRDGSVSTVVYLDDLLAARPEMVADVDAALIERLDQRITLAAVPVPAAVANSGAATPGTRPLILVTQYDMRSAQERTSSTRVRSDFTGDGYRIRPNSRGYDLYYAIEALAGSRSDQAAMLEAIVAALPPTGSLDVAGMPVPFEHVTPPPLERMGGDYTGRLFLHYRVSALLDLSGIDLVRPVRSVEVNVDHGSPA